MREHLCQGAGLCFRVWGFTGVGFKGSGAWCAFRHSREVGWVAEGVADVGDDFDAEGSAHLSDLCVALFGVGLLQRGVR